jgi:hypothetical protein
MRILLTTFDPIFLLPPTHPSGSCGSTAHARAWSWAGLRLVRAARGFGGVGFGVKSPQRLAAWHHKASATKLSLCAMARRARRASARAHASHALSLLADAAACSASRKAKPAKTNMTLHPFEGPDFPFPLRGTVKPSPLPSRSFPFEGFPDRVRPPRLRRAYHDAHAS